MNKWVRMPTSWIRDRLTLGLKKFDTQDTGGSIAALLIYMSLAFEVNGKDHKEEGDPDTVEVTYDYFVNFTNLSRAMISRGLRKLEEANLIEIAYIGKKNIYKLMNNSSDRGWCKLPKSYIIQNGVFNKLTHRSRNELYALKMYFLFMAFRQNTWNFALISYPKIIEYTGIPSHHIRSGLSLLINHVLIHIDRSKEIDGKKGNPPSQYRICGIDPYRHKGTQKEETFLDDDIRLPS